MEYLLVIFIIGALFYYFSNVIYAVAESVEDSTEIWVRDIKVDNQEKIVKLKNKIEKTIKENKGWYTLDYLDSFIKKNIKK